MPILRPEHPTEDDLKSRLLSALHKTPKSSKEIDFDKNAEYMMLDTGYCLRFKKLNDASIKTDNQSDYETREPK